MSTEEKVREILKMISESLTGAMDHIKENLGHTLEISFTYRDIYYTILLTKRPDSPYPEIVTDGHHVDPAPQDGIVIRLANITRLGVGEKLTEGLKKAAVTTEKSEPGDGTLLIALVVIYLNEIITEAGEVISYWEGGFSDFWRRKEQICCGINSCGCHLSPNFREFITKGKSKSEISELNRQMDLLEKKQLELNKLLDELDFTAATELSKEIKKLVDMFLCLKHKSGCESEVYTNACRVATGRSSYPEHRINNDLFLMWSNEQLASRGVEIVEGEIIAVVAKGGGKSNRTKVRRTKKRRAKKKKTKKRRKRTRK